MSIVLGILGIFVFIFLVVVILSISNVFMNWKNKDKRLRNIGYAVLSIIVFAISASFFK